MKTPWSKFWEAGTITTFKRHFEQNYDGEFLNFWQAAFDGFAAGAKALDLGTGNGALLGLLDDRMRGLNRRVQAIGVDAAKVSQKHVAGFDFIGCELLDKCLIQDTGLPDDSIDHIISQFGLEYAPLSAALMEIDRVAKP